MRGGGGMPQRVNTISVPVSVLRITGPDSPRRGSIAQITDLLARARPSSALARSRSAHRPKHYTNPRISAAWKTQWRNASLIEFTNFQLAIFRRELDW